MSDDTAALIARYRRRGLLVDTNLLLVLTIGSFDRRLINSLSRLDDYNEDDLDLITRLVAHFEVIVTTPHVLAEVSNLSTAALWRIHHYRYLMLFAEIIKRMTEEYVPSEDAAQLPVFPRLALTDAAIEQAARDKYLVVSADLPLVEHLRSVGVAVINFNHLRELAWRVEPPRGTRLARRSHQ